MAERRVLSSLDLVPEDAQDEIVWAMGELNARRRSQADILFELNDRLAVRGVDPISKSAFSRAAVRAEKSRRAMAERNALIAAIAPMATPDKVREADLVIGELLKMLVAAILEKDDLTSEDAFNLAQAHLKSIQAQEKSTELKKAAEAEFAAKLGAAAEKVASVRGITAQARRQIMEQLGVIQKGA